MKISQVTIYMPDDRRVTYLLGREDSRGLVVTDIQEGEDGSMAIAFNDNTVLGYKDMPVKMVIQL
ncbi:gp40 [Listeria phage P40]|uniref:gp40 n=1 Tax=Listeria phage P40 TaxID=560178 RepID=UPI00018198F5|nr:gp40 [Listeria phage P40]ACI00400.1 gp40 [Listeria phage P40]